MRAQWLRFIMMVGILVICQCPEVLWAAELQPLADTATVRDRNDPLSIKHFDENAMSEYWANPQFDYGVEMSQLSWWDRLKRWLTYKFMELFMKEGSVNYLEWLILGIGVAVLVYVIVRLSGMDMKQLLVRAPARSPLAYSAGNENIHEIDFDSELQQAVSQKNYRLGVRLLYLDCLKKLSDRQLIDWKPTKTNAIYLEELTNNELKGDFAWLTRQFEYIWYGDFQVAEERFADLEREFQAFGKEVRK